MPRPGIAVEPFLSVITGPPEGRPVSQMDLVETKCVRVLEPPRLSCVTAWLRSVCVPDLLTGTHTMLRQPVHGFAKPVADTVARAMAILQSRPDFTTKPEDRPLSGNTASRKQPE